jgi:hypothetical protein
MRFNVVAEGRVILEVAVVKMMSLCSDVCEIQRCLVIIMPVILHLSWCDVAALLTNG